MQKSLVRRLNILCAPDCARSDGLDALPLVFAQLPQCLRRERGLAAPVAKQVTEVFKKRLEAGFAGIGERVHAHLRSPSGTWSNRRKPRSDLHCAEPICSHPLLEADHFRGPIKQ